jgi:hypothetical protein
LKSNIN